MIHNPCINQIYAKALTKNAQCILELVLYTLWPKHVGGQCVYKTNFNIIMRICWYYFCIYLKSYCTLTTL